LNVKIDVTENQVNKLSDAELHLSAKREALEHGASFLGPAQSYKYGLFRLADGREIELDLYAVHAGRWPRNIERFLARQAATRGWSRAKMLQRVRALAEGAGARVLDLEWNGPHHWYSFDLADGRVVQIRGSKLMISGWPSDIDAYLAWSSARRQLTSGPRSTIDLFREFKEDVARNNGRVVSPTWLGARTPHTVLLSDGTLRELKPNQLKYFGWPIVPFDELRKLAPACSVSILPDTAHLPTQLFRVDVSGGIYLEGNFAELKTALADGTEAQIRAAVQWARQARLTPVAAKWQGALARYEFVEASGTTVVHTLPAAAAHEVRRLAAAELAKLRRVGTMHGAKLLSQDFAGKTAIYSWERDGVAVCATVAQLLEHSRTQVRFAQLKQRVHELGLGAELLSTEWAGLCKPYQWRLPNGSEITAKLSQLRLLARSPTVLLATPAASPAKVRGVEALVFETGAGDKALEVLSDWAHLTGLKLLSTEWVAPVASYEWELPDGSVVVASLKKVRNCTRAVLRQRAGSGLAKADERTLTESECAKLVERLAQSKSQ
jgi:hypothetical protein